MKLTSIRFAAGALIALAACGGALADPARDAADPYLWLEDVGGERALDWVRERNRISTAHLQATPDFAALRAGMKEVLDSKERIPYVFKQGAWYYNFWKDGAHPRGILRRTTLKEYARKEPRWDTVIDVDQLAAAEKENWVWGGIDCLEPQANRCLVSLTRGGGDAHVVREFDMRLRRFVPDGFVLPEAKGGLSWIDKDRVFVETDFGPGSMTTSGYPRIIKEWRRGTPLTEAHTIYEGRAEDTSVGAWKEQDPRHGYEFVIRRMTFFTNELYLRDGGKLRKLDKPDDASAWTVRDQLLVELRSDWDVGGQRYPQGALLAIGMDSFLKGRRDFSVLFTPTATTSLQSTAHTRNAILLSEMDNVRGRVEELRLVGGKWQRRTVATPAFGSLTVSAADPLRSDEYFLTTADFLTPARLEIGKVGSDRRTLLKSLPAFFDASPLKVEQFSARAADGTAIPYFAVMRKDVQFNGANPTLLYGYGGFEITQRPFYSGILGRSWLARGGVYVLANIRGGGEFGPRWHQAALKEKRQVSYSDFITVAEDLVAKKLTSPRHLGIQGGSLGGMLVSVAMLQRPDLFNAVVSQVPLTDMRRYHKMLAGASWIDEYGDPDVPEQWDYISRYSPYHNVETGKTYPAVLYTSSTRDDRVHPAHARKMVALLEEKGQQVLYWENIDGGHGGAVNSDQQAQLNALVYSFLWSRLK
jgi:prolyl oligopeptidase